MEENDHSWLCNNSWSHLLFLLEFLQNSDAICLLQQCVSLNWGWLRTLGREGSKNWEKVVTSFMNGPLCHENALKMKKCFWTRTRRNQDISCFLVSPGWKALGPARGWEWSGGKILEKWQHIESFFYLAWLTKVCWS